MFSFLMSALHMLTNKKHFGRFVMRVNESVGKSEIKYSYKESEYAKHTCITIRFSWRCCVCILQLLGLQKKS